MWTPFLRQLNHDRRRYAFATALTLAAGGFGGGLFPDPLPISTEALVALAFLAVIPLFTARFPARRHWVELAALGNLIVTAAGKLYPAGLFGWHDAGQLLFLQIPACVGIGWGLNLLIYTPWSDRYAPRRRYVVKTRLYSRLSLHELWHGMVPTPGYLDRNPDREVVSIDFADATKTVVRLTTWTPPRVGTGEVTLKFQEIRPLKYARFTLRVLRGNHDPEAEGETELIFEDRGRYRVLWVHHKVNGFSPRRAILGYFDDTLGRLMTARLTAIEARVASGAPTKAATGFNSWFGANGTIETAEELDRGGYRTAFGRRRSDDETRALEALGKG